MRKSESNEMNRKTYDYTHQYIICVPVNS